MSASNLLLEEFAKPRTPYLSTLLARGKNASHLDLYWDTVVGADDQLRQRMGSALSQIIVVSDRGVNFFPKLAMAHYADILHTHAFGNYRDLLKDITYSPAMSQYLTYMYNRKGNMETGSEPDENYAREFMQLFTIGLFELNMDGSQRLDVEGNPIPTYGSDDVAGLSRVFTGLGFSGPNFYTSTADDDAFYKPIIMFPAQHSERDKTFLGLTIPAGTDGDTSIDMAIDHIFDQPSVAPFISRQLIQRFTMSHPTPDYVERVATAFETGRFVAPDGVTFGDGRKGDLQATLAAILLDPTQFDEAFAESESAGKIREPVLRFTQWARAFEAAPVLAENEQTLSDTNNPILRLGQQPLRAPSVFNFYRPGFIAPGTESGANDLTAPEFQIVNDGTFYGYANFMTDFVIGRQLKADLDVESFIPDYSTELALADDAEALTNHLNMLLTGGRLDEVVSDRVIEILNEIPILEASSDEDRLTRVHVAITLVITSPAYTFQR
ncbi:MAG: DUF1800 family protein [Pseudomonadota bacterium]